MWTFRVFPLCAEHTSTVPGAPWSLSVACLVRGRRPISHLFSAARSGASGPSLSSCRSSPSPSGQPLPWRPDAPENYDGRCGILTCFFFFSACCVGTPLTAFNQLPRVRRFLFKFPPLILSFRAMPSGITRFHRDAVLSSSPVFFHFLFITGRFAWDCSLTCGLVIPLPCPQS